MRFVLIGDLHGFPPDDFLRACPPDDVVIQVGDLGAYEDVPRPMYFVDGNHDDFDLIHGAKMPTGEVAKNLIHVSRGTVMEFDGGRIRVGFLGGADSVDRPVRFRNGLYWSGREQITEEEVAVAKEMGRLDLLVTHCAPTSVVNQMFPDDQTLFFAEMGWEKDTTSEDRLQEVWDHLGRPPIVCGHYHRRAKIDGVTVLDIGEVLILDL